MSKSWLEKAVSDDDARKELMKPHGKIATDGMRAHIDDTNGACKCGNDRLHENLNRFLENIQEDLPFAFIVNRQYLLDALSGLNPDGKAVVFFMKPGGTNPIVIQEPDGERTAIIMPMYIKNGAEFKKLPRAARTKKSSSKKVAKAQS